jgi:hypothetical protein
MVYFEEDPELQVFYSTFTVYVLAETLDRYHPVYSGADKSLARPGRKQATATEDFDFHISYL